MDNAVNARDAKGVFSRREELLSLLKSIQPENNEQTESYLQFLIDHVPGITQKESDYLKNYFFTQGVDSLWGENFSGKPIEPIVRLGLIKAIEEAIARNLPLDSYWEAADTDTEFETIIICSAYQVTRLIRTPHPTAPSGFSPLRNDSPIFLLKHGERDVIIRDPFSGK